MHWRSFQTPAPRGGVPLKYTYGQKLIVEGRFKPLRLGAVFLWIGIAVGTIVELASFKPLRLGAVFLWNPPAATPKPAPTFQTPAPRGGVPLNPTVSWKGGDRIGFKPLRLGAVFLWRNLGHGLGHGDLFQTPAPRGGVPLI